MQYERTTVTEVMPVDTGVFPLRHACKSQVCVVCVLCAGTGKAGAKAADSKKNAKKTAAVAKPNSIKSLFMNSNVKKPAEVCDVRLRA